MAGRAITQISFHPDGSKGAPIRVDANRERRCAWVTINSYVDAGHEPTAPVVTFHFADRAAVMALRQELDRAAAVLLEAELADVSIRG